MKNFNATDGYVTFHMENKRPDLKGKRPKIKIYPQFPKNESCCDKCSNFKAKEWIMIDFLNDLEEIRDIAIWLHTEFAYQAVIQTLESENQFIKDLEEARKVDPELANAPFDL